MAAGWTQARLADRLGLERANMGALMRRPRVHAATARAVSGLYDQLWNAPPPGRSSQERGAANRARRYAAARGWALPGAWDDDDIDDPVAGPAAGWRRQDRRTTRPGVELAADARELAGYGLTREQAAERLGVPKNTLDQCLARHPEAEIESVA